MNSNPKELKNVEIFFDGYSSDFDNIYDDKSNNFIQRLINKYLRFSMFNRYQLTINRIKEDINSKNILDIGCGTGRYCNKLAQLDKNILGIDVAETMIMNSKEFNKSFKNNCKFETIDYLNFSKNNNNVFDYAILMGFFDYIEEPIKIYKSLKKDSKISLASFPKKFHILTPQRYIKYNYRKCPIFFYTKIQIEKLMKDIDAKNYQIIDNHREFFVISEF
jgi:SAM-dependent methyltransferase